MRLHFWGWMIWSLVACGGGGGSADSGIDVPPDMVPVETVAPDSPADSPIPDTPDENTTEAFDAPDVRPACTSDSDCPGAFCLRFEDGRFCSASCADSPCPTGFDCATVTGASGPIKTCLVRAPNQCRPCREDTDCEASGVMAPMHCLPLQGLKYCLRGCASPVECGTDAACQAIGSSPPVCVPSLEVCYCTEEMTQAKVSGACFRSNDFGTCPGEFVCPGWGPSACSAPVPTFELCNGKDDDCDGETDEGTSGTDCVLGNEYGTCPGKLTCAAGKPTCEGSYAQPEACNDVDDDCDGLTDEELPDSNHNGIADCKETDEDKDSIPDVSDNCVGAWNPDQADTDTDGKGDACDPDDDDDGVEDALDNCPLLPNPAQKDVDQDGKGDICDCDLDGDAIANDNPGCPPASPPDNCLMIPNPDQADLDGNGLGDACDPDRDGDGVPNEQDGCPDAADPDQSDRDTDGFGDACDPDIDGDGVPNDADTCPRVADPLQEDLDGDGEGDVCDCDLDGDGVPNPNPDCPIAIPLDNCPWVFDPGQSDYDRDGLGDACDDDRDGDGDVDETDCAPLDPAVSHGAPEACNGQDDDCDTEVDEDDAEGCDLYLADWDGDGYGSGDIYCLCGPVAPFTTMAAGDCDDADPTRNPGADEACDGRDSDCDGLTDPPGTPGCVERYVDADRDGWGTGLAACLCTPMNETESKTGGDCADTDPLVHPGQAETCNGVDDDCDGLTDPEGTTGCINRYLDEDGDGFGTTSKCLCAPQGAYTATTSGDCDDVRSGVHPEAPETCDGSDEDCDGLTDEAAEGCVTLFWDEDGDGYGKTSKCLCAPSEFYIATKGGDCADSDATVHPGQQESCNARDDDCDGITDPEYSAGCAWRFYDADGDGFGAKSVPGRCLCKPEGQFSAPQAGDCDDADKAVNPKAVETCNGKDDNCDGVTDPDGANLCKSYYPDVDGDGFGSGEAVCKCGPGGTYTTQSTGDCCDQDKNAYPGQKAWFGAVNSCGSWDYDCSGKAEPSDTSANGGCNLHPNCGAKTGWQGATPACGESRAYITGGCVKGSGQCGAPTKETRTQQCH